jgi:hypothetical protein
MKRSFFVVASSLVVGLASTASFGSPPSQETGLSLPLRLTTWAVSMGTVATGRNAVIDINVTRWSTPAERETLIEAFRTKGQDGLLRELQRTKTAGRIRIPGWQGPDPHKFLLGWDLHYAVAVPIVTSVSRRRAINRARSITRSR